MSTEGCICTTLSKTWIAGAHLQGCPCATPPVYFYGGHVFSNYWISPIVVNGYHYATVEHYYQAQKATSLDDFVHVRSAPTPGQAKKRARGIKLREDWEAIKYGIMLIGLRAKFAIPEFRKVLLDTGDAKIYEDSPTDFIWGYRNNGKNLLGKALMEVREEIKNEQGPSK